jgi:CheY-like chemotaxis protein
MSATPQQAMPAQKLILIVDDTPTNIGVISGALKDSYKTKIATNGPKALALACAEEKPDLILLDVMMPEMDGYEVCMRLKADPSTREIPVIFLTGQTGAEDETRGFEVGAVDYVHKPFSPAVVKARVRSHILLRESGAQIAAQLLALNNELEMARQIQLSILPHTVPQIPGLEIVARFRPMTAVAGDFYDFVQIDDKHLGILIADVSGHGLPSALIASMLQAKLRYCRICLCGSGKEPNAIRRRGPSTGHAISSFDREDTQSVGEWAYSRNVLRSHLQSTRTSSRTGRTPCALH